jgi:hypothetical protein
LLKVNQVAVPMFRSQKTCSKIKDHTHINMRSVLFWVIMQRIVGFLIYILGLPIGPEMSLRNHHYTLSNNPEEHRSHVPCCGSLISCMC